MDEGHWGVVVHTWRGDGETRNTQREPSQAESTQEKKKKRSQGRGMRTHSGYRKIRDVDEPATATDGRGEGRRREA